MGYEISYTRKEMNLRTDSTDTTIYSPYFSLCLLLRFYSFPGYVKCQSLGKREEYLRAREDEVVVVLHFLFFSPARLLNSIVQSFLECLSAKERAGRRWDLRAFH
jgi:hypothetical protein